MRIAKALERRDAAIMAVRDLISSAKLVGMTSADMNADFLKIKARLLPIGKAPQWVRSYVEGYFRCEIDKCYDEHLVFGGFYTDGKFYSTHRNRADYYQSNGIEPSEYANVGKISGRGHYWAHSLKPFFVDKA